MAALLNLSKLRESCERMATADPDSAEEPLISMEDCYTIDGSRYEKTEKLEREKFGETRLEKINKYTLEYRERQKNLLIRRDLINSKFDEVIDDIIESSNTRKVAETASSRIEPQMAKKEVETVVRVSPPKAITETLSRKVDVKNSRKIRELEREINNLTGINGDKNFQSVMKRMAPDASGHKFVKSWTAGETESVFGAWSFESLYDQSQLRVIIYVQDNKTKEVLQTAYIDAFEDYTAIKEDLKGELFTVFPNPTNGVAHMLFSKPLEKEVSVYIYDQVGKIVDQINVEIGVNKVTFNTFNYPNGIYYVKLTDANGNFKTKKLSVIR